VTYGMALCAGGGGLELGVGLALGDGYRCVCYVENEAYAAATLVKRMEEERLAPAAIWDDLVTFDPEPWRGKVDILSAGFPCQPHSQAGAQLHGDDPRELSGEVLRIADGLGLPDLFLENVPGILRFYWDSIRPQLREMGYRVAEGLFTAAETGAPHRRERLFILAHAGHAELSGRISDAKGSTWVTRNKPTSQSSELADTGCESERQPCSGFDSRGDEPSEAAEVRATERDGLGDGERELADTDDEGLQGWDECSNGAREWAARTSSPELGELPLFPPGPTDRDGWAYVLSVMPQAQPTFCRVDDGLAGRMVADRLAMLGNGVAPLEAAYAYRTLNTQMMEASQWPLHGTTSARSRRDGRDQRDAVRRLREAPRGEGRVRYGDRVQPVQDPQRG
jgi:DNA (cytosine-5)-methyltransferase 1